MDSCCKSPGRMVWLGELEGMVKRCLLVTLARRVGTQQLWDKDPLQPHPSSTQTGSCLQQFCRKVPGLLGLPLWMGQVHIKKGYESPFCTCCLLSVGFSLFEPSACLLVRASSSSWSQCEPLHSSWHPSPAVYLGLPLVYPRGALHFSFRAHLFKRLSPPVDSEPLRGALCLCVGQHCVQGMANAQLHFCWMKELSNKYL